MAAGTVTCGERAADDPSREETCRAMARTAAKLERRKGAEKNPHHRAAWDQAELMRFMMYALRIVFSTRTGSFSFHIN